jgi:hypothetical protein
MKEDPAIYTAPSSATATDDCRGKVMISGSYGGEYNAYHAGKWGIRGVVLNDAGVGKNSAGIRGLEYLDRMDLPGATADAGTCHLGDGEHMLRHGRISYINRSAVRCGCKVGDSVRRCAELMGEAPIVTAPMPPISGGRRYTIRESPGEPAIVCLDAAPMLSDDDVGRIVVTGSHAALFRGRPDDVVRPQVRAIFFSDAGVGMDGAGIARLPCLDERGIVAGTASAASAEIGDSRSIYEEGILSHVNAAARAMGGRAGLRIKDFVRMLSADRSNKPV